MEISQYLTCMSDNETGFLRIHHPHRAATKLSSTESALFGNAPAACETLLYISERKVLVTFRFRLARFPFSRYVVSQAHYGVVDLPVTAYLPDGFAKTKLFIRILKI
jgi:hypothetical protein